MFDRFEPFRNLTKIDFSFKPKRFEMWMGGMMIDSGLTQCSIQGVVRKAANFDFVDVSSKGFFLTDELAETNTFDRFITSNDRLQLLVIPEFTNNSNVAIELFKMNIGPSRKQKNFNRNEPYCCNMFLLDGILDKVTFSFSNPEKLIEFYSN